MFPGHFYAESPNMNPCSIKQDPNYNFNPVQIEKLTFHSQ